ncbi:ABC-F family ATP-binding cassette domain-containing protein [Clostridium cylindrosporum]|uniref:ABC-type transport system, ATP-binding protein n=1 Tax=Clostridium cylindrosporum DSM 605 TaxID=1121307 RepID=A0A0J8D9J2_CLOCY|nr:ABC-F family ATP-binding cassette domain-containing protein [Clostridium cylindrosporum]KMT20968.1 ABC-type transport system, ATP-binding protein [Clostridium cylindrosporum DSM 605]
MNLITLESISKSYSEKKLIENISLGINDGDKIGIIGVNGTGKSTLLKIIAGKMDYDEGKITKGSKVRIEYLSQSPEFELSDTVLGQVFRGNSDEMKLIRDYEYYLEKSRNNEDVSDKLIEIQGKIDALNLWEMESEAKKVLTKLGISNFNEKIINLSGGQKKRVALASALITPCDILVLDEPTNHMDNETITWLEEYLNSKQGAIIMITHDRYFLDRVTNRIIELDRGNLYSYEGNYSVFLEKKLERMENEKSREEKKQSLIRTELKWVKRGAKARTTKQKARLQRFDELVSSVDEIRKETLDISVASSRLGKKVIEINNISKSYGDKKLIDDFSYTILRNDRVGIVGNNGMGKSTLMKILNGDLSVDSGSIDKGETVRIGYFSQESDHMDVNMRAIDYIKEAAEFIENAEGVRISASQMCERFLFDGTLQYTHIGKLSGGERRRLYLLKILSMAPNLLLLDEPTNDLDIETLKILEEYLDEFNGAVIVISHDRYFLDRICDKIFAYEGRGYIKQYPGNYSDYILRKEIENIKEEANSKVVVENKSDKNDIKTPKSSDKKLKFSFKEQREFDTIDEDIEMIEEKISKIEKEIENAATDYSLLQELIEKKEKEEKLLEEKYERWEYLNQLSEEIERNKLEAKKK